MKEEEEEGGRNVGLPRRVAGWLKSGASGILGQMVIFQENVHIEKFSELYG